VGAVPVVIKNWGYAHNARFGAGRILGYFFPARDFLLPDRLLVIGTDEVQCRLWNDWPTPDLCTTLSERIGVQVTRSVQQGAA